MQKTQPVPTSSATWTGPAPATWTLDLVPVTWTLGSAPATWTQGPTPVMWTGPAPATWTGPTPAIWAVAKSQTRLSMKALAHSA